MSRCGPTVVFLRSSYDTPSICMRPQDLLLAPELTAAEVDEFLRSYGFKDPGGADRNLQLMAEDFVQRELLARIIEGLLNAAQLSPDPDAAFNNLERFLAVV